jgi:hypothetical protein
LRQFRWEIKFARDMPIVLLTEAGYVLRTNNSRITREQEGRRGNLQRGLLVEADSVLSHINQIENHAIDLFGKSTLTDY